MERTQRVHPTQVRAISMAALQCRSGLWPSNETFCLSLPPGTASLALPQPSLPALLLSSSSSFSYQYYLPASVLGLALDGSEADRERLERLAAAWGRFQGTHVMPHQRSSAVIMPDSSRQLRALGPGFRKLKPNKTACVLVTPLPPSCHAGTHPFHNYTKRRLYREIGGGRGPRRDRRGDADAAASSIDSDSEAEEAEEAAASSSSGGSASGSGAPHAAVDATTAAVASSLSYSAEAVAAVSSSSSISSSMDGGSSSVEGEDGSMRGLIKLDWKHERDNADPVVRRHFR